MSKKQKVWLWIFIAMFAVPEVLWNPVGNFLYSWFSPLQNGSIRTLRDNFLMKSNNLNLYSFILFVQFLGMLLFLIIFLMNGKKVKSRSLFLLTTAVIFLVVIILLLIFGLSITLRHISI
jgi:hypothetical protein